MKRTLATTTIAAAALALTGCIPLPPTSAFVAEALPLLEEAGAVFPERDDNASREQMTLELGEGMCVAADELEGQPTLLGMDGMDFMPLGMAGALQIDADAAGAFIELSFEHLCPEHAD